MYNTILSIKIILLTEKLRTNCKNNFCIKNSNKYIN